MTQSKTHIKQADFPFPLAFLNWCKEKKHATTLKETESRALVREFYYSKYWNEKPITGLDYLIAVGASI